MKNIDDKSKSIALRKEGYTLTEICKEINRAKSTVMGWIKNVEISVKSQEILDRKRKEGVLAFQKAGTEGVKKKFDKQKRTIYQEGYDYIASFDEVPQDIVLSLCLYWGEGRKFSSLGLSNTDPLILRAFKDFMINRALIDKKNIRVSLCFYNDICTKENVERYWSNLLDIDFSQFYKSVINNKPQKSAGNKVGKHPYGVCCVSTSKKSDTYRILGMIEALQNKISAYKVNETNLTKEKYNFIVKRKDKIEVNKYNLLKQEKFKEGKAFIDNFDIIPLDVLSAVSLYWAEGSKSNKFAISNSDPKIILLFRNFLYKYYKLDKTDIKVRLSFYDNFHTKEQVENYWSSLLVIDKNQFYKSGVLKYKKEKPNKKVGKLPFGVCSLGTSKRYDLYKMLGMIDSVRERLIK